MSFSLQQSLEKFRTLKSKLRQISDQKIDKKVFFTDQRSQENHIAMQSNKDIKENCKIQQKNEPTRNSIKNLEQTRRKRQRSFTNRVQNYKQIKNQRDILFQKQNILKEINGLLQRKRQTLSQIQLTIQNRGIEKKNYQFLQKDTVASQFAKQAQKNARQFAPDLRQLREEQNKIRRKNKQKKGQNAFFF